MERRTNYFISIFLLFCLFSNKSFAQPTWTLDPFGTEKKPDKYEEKTLGSEKTATKKFGPVRHFIQNNVSHYNFYFNANAKLNLVLERAKIAQKDDYSRLIGFYPYTLSNTASQKTELDSVIYKCTAGILLHDLRSDWVDNMYMLVGKAYFFRKELDSANMTFQFINYNLFPRKKNEDDGRLIGTNNSEQYNVITIANKEKRNIVQKAFTLPPSRNDALIWLTRTLTEKDQLGDAAGLINILQNDPNLPKRLRNDLEEVTAYWFYKQKTYDSAAIHLERGLSTAENKADKARWEFLLGQLFEISGDFDKASTYYKKAAKHTTDPIMDIYARLNDAKMFRTTGNDKELKSSISNLVKMGKKDKFESYRDIVYYSSGQLSMQVHDTANAIIYFKKSIKYNESNPSFKNKAFLQLGNLAYSDRKYRMALNYYDSLALPDTTNADEFSGIEERRNSLRSIVKQITIIEREDSLQMIAGMSPADRDAFIKKLAKKFRKLEGQKDDDGSGSGSPISFTSKNGEAKDLFEPAKGDWYFYNASSKSKGFGEFKSKWGKRENVDNWRRKAAMEAAAKSYNGNIDIDQPLDSSAMNGLDGSKPLENSYDGLMSNVPLTKEQRDSSNNSIAKAYLKLAKGFQFELGDYQQAINTYEDYLKRFPDRLADGEVYLGLYYCYSKLGNESKAAYYKNLLLTGFAGSKAANMINNPSAVDPSKKNPEVTQRYERIYNKFIEGDFANAVAEKKQADSVYGKNYWTPQLLYIEAISYIRDRNDSVAIKVLNDIISLYPTSALKEKAATMIDVLGRRAEIESYLSKLQVTRATEEDRVIMPDEKGVQAPQQKTDVTLQQPKQIETIKNPQLRTDSLIKTPPSMISGVYTWQSGRPHTVIMILNKVDPVYINEAKNAFTRYNKENFSSKNIAINKDQLDADRALLVFTSFENAEAAVSYFDKVKKAAPAEVSWLQQNKYSFLVISYNNLQLLKTNKDVDVYKVLLSNQYPGKF